MIELPSNSFLKIFITFNMFSVYFPKNTLGKFHSIFYQVTCYEAFLLFIKLQANSNIHYIEFNFFFLKIPILYYFLYDLNINFITSLKYIHLKNTL